MKVYENKTAGHNVTNDTTIEGYVAVINDASASGLGDLDEQIKSLMVTGQNRSGKRQYICHICTICGKEGNQRNIMDHIESNHLEGVCHFCTLCEKTFRY